METTVWIELISTLGFPIACVIACGLVLYKFMKRWIEDASERETSLESANEKFSEALSKVADTIIESNNINRELSETNRTLVERVETNLSTINNNVERIIDTLNNK